ncbi:MAG: DUF4384 domain-containing protein [Nostoc sp. DcaGUA01]|nr:DUF4384 domain-containing protein [Nostoc sp. DcaGUA01]
MSFDPITSTIKAIASAGTPAVKNSLERTTFVIQLKKRLGLDPDHPPADFTGVYQYALVEYGTTKPKLILELFGQKEIIQAFRQAFEHKDQSPLPKPIEDFLDWNELGDRIREQKIDVSKELDEFKAAFINVAKKTQTPADVILNQSLEEIRQLLASPPLTLKQLWEQLQRKATPTKQIKVSVVKDVLDMGSDFHDIIPLGSNIRLQVNLEYAGYLLLLDRGTSQRVWCLCPSGYAPDPYLPAGVTILPQNSSSRTAIKVTGDIGLEQIVAVISQSAPSLNWLHKNIGKPLELKEDELMELLEYLNQNPDCQVLYMEYTITT